MSDEPAPRTAFAWLPAALYMVLIWLMSSLSNPPSAAEMPFRDKGVHFLEYGMLATLLARALRLTRPLDRAFTTWLLAAFCATFFGLTDEIHQAFVPSRNADAHDLVADALGAAVGAAAYLLVTKLARKNAAH